MLAVTILGNNSAIPAFGRHPTAQIITTADDLLMFDCGEGSQIQILNYRIKRSRINHIFISHLHGDHYFGLIGLLNSFALLGRIQPLHVYGIPALEEVISLQFRLSSTTLPFQFTFHPIEEAGILLDSKSYTVECFATQHRIECWGFLVREKRQPRKININKTTDHAIPTSAFNKLQAGEDFIAEDGAVIKNELLTDENVKAKSYAFCADTIYDEKLVPIIKDADLVYHESTYPAAFAEKATERFHSTSKQAATIALKANAGRLLIGHFSAKFEVIEQFETEAKEVFENTELATEGVTYLV
jgi:ribonuclease Z